MKIAIISDTHSLLRPEVEEKLKDCDYILHGGDIASKETFERIGVHSDRHLFRNF